MTPKYDWALDFFGGRDVSKDFASYSNIVFSKLLNSNSSSLKILDISKLKIKIKNLAYI